MASKEENESSVSPSICSSVQDENNNANNQPLSRRRTNSRNTRVNSSNPSNPAIPQPPHAHGISPQQARPNMNRPPSMLYII